MVYIHVIEDVISKVYDEFVNNGPEESVLKELQGQAKMEIFYYLVFGAMGAVVTAMVLSKTNKDRINTSSAFNSFKNNYLLVYSLMMAGHWLQGPYIYYLYITYGFGTREIGQLFIAGFGSTYVVWNNCWISS